MGWFHVLSFCAQIVVVLAEWRNAGWNSQDRSFWDNDHQGSRTFASLGRHQLWSAADCVEAFTPCDDSSPPGNSCKSDEQRLSLFSSEWPPSVLTPSSPCQSRIIRLTSLRTKSVSERLKGQVENGSPETEKHEAAEVEGITLPLIPSDAWESMTGSEFEDDPSAIHKLSRSGLIMATQEWDANPWVTWKATIETEKALQKSQQLNKPSIMMSLLQGDILVYVGKAKREEGFVGSHLPMIKTQSVLPFAAEEVADLLMDSSKVKVYNKMSLGRKDLKILNDQTKIVRNLTQPPIAKSKMLSVTLMHARPLRDSDFDLLQSMKTSSLSTLKNGYLVVSRAVPKADTSTEYADIPRNDILLGVNLIQELNAHECVMTAVTHVYSPSLPTMLVTRFGISGARNFVKDVRGAAAAEKVLK
jgi:hypothetical protein